MGKDSKIEWTDHTFNAWIGCTKVSPGCAHCYAERSYTVKVRGIGWGRGADRVRTRAEYWKQPVLWNKRAEKAGVRERVFCASLSDWLDEAVPVAWLADLLKLIHDTPHLDWLLLTKRPENWSRRILAAWQHEDRADEHGERCGFLNWLSFWNNRQLAPANVWVGTTVENQEMADQRIPMVLNIPARVRFLSCEPLLGSVDVRFGAFNGSDSFGSLEGIHWVICGGESGPGARPMHPMWARFLRGQCQAAGVPFFFKQWGEWRPAIMADDWLREVDPKKIHHFELPVTQPPMVRVGKQAAGRVLDGRTWDELPVKVS